jgi:hypothetical protein
LGRIPSWLMRVMINSGVAGLWASGAKPIIQVSTNPQLEATDRNSINPQVKKII